MSVSKMSVSEMIKRVMNFVKSDSGVLLLLTVVAVTALMWGCSDGGDVLAAATILPGTVAGKHVVDGPLTTVETETGAPGLLRSEIDERIVKIRPMSTPVDQISRYAGHRHSGSIKVEYYAVDTKKSESKVTKGAAAGTGQGIDGFQTAVIRVEEPDLFEPTDTLLLPGVKTAEGEDLVVYVVSKSDAGLTVAPANNEDRADGVHKMPAVDAGTAVIRMGRAAGELDVQTSQYEALPEKKFNYCQIFKAQVEQSTLMKLANKEVGWTFSDQEEAAVVDMRAGMERNFLFGSRCRVYDQLKREHIHLTGGIWNQAGRETDYTVKALDHKALVKIARMAFTDNAGSSRKILIGGTGLIEQLHNMEHYKTVDSSGFTRWGLDFTEIRTKFGTLYVISSEVFDKCGHVNDGLVIDPEYLTKYSHIPFKTERLDLRSSGVRNTDAVVITEASCLVLRYPTAHMRIVGKTESTDSNA